MTIDLEEVKQQLAASPVQNLIGDDALRAVEQLQADKARLERELEEAREDEKRYRWLRQQHWSEADLCAVAFPKDAVKLGHDCPSLERLDAAIDAARKKQG